MLIATPILDANELGAYGAIKAQFSGLTLEQAYNAVCAAKGFIEAMNDETEETFTFK